MISGERYARLLADRRVRYLWLASVLGRLPIGMCGLAILLLVQASRGSFASAGVVTGAYVTGLALFAPVQGRLIDRQGPRTVLLVCAVLFPASLVALVLAVAAHAEPALPLALAALAGATFPPITVCMRTFLRQRFSEDASLATAYSIDSVLIEIMFIAGPMLVAVLVAGATPAAAVISAAACGLIGTVLFTRSRALGDWRIEVRDVQRGLLGPLEERSFVGLLAVVACYATAFGLTEIGVAAFAGEMRKPALAGLFLAIMSATSAAGGLAYGSRHWHGALSRQFAATLAILGIGLLPLALPASGVAFSLLCAIAGLVMAPALIIQSMLVAKTARAEHMTEAFTWSTSALLVGVAVGMTLGGVLVEHWRSPAAFGAAAATALAAATGARFLPR
jgi:MFS family permease